MHHVVPLVVVVGGGATYLFHRRMFSRRYRLYIIHMRADLPLIEVESPRVVGECSGFRRRPCLVRRAFGEKRTVGVVLAGLEPQRHSVRGLGEVDGHLHGIAVAQAEGFAELSRGRRARAHTDAIVGRDVAGAVHTDRILEGEPQLRLARQLAPVGDQRAGHLGQAVDVAGRRAGHVHIPAEHLFVLGIEEEVLNQLATGAHGRREVGSQQPLGIAVQ